MNAAAGAPTLVSRRFAETVRCALAVAEQTAGLVDPTVGASLVALGYGRDFADLGDDAAPPAPVGPAPGWRRIDLSGRLLRMPRGCMLDLNGVVKSATVDEAAALLRGDGFVSAGGDLAVRGGTDVALPAGGAVRVVRGGIATTGTQRRRWRRGGVWYHHLIDPATGLPARSPWREVTASGASCLDADVGGARSAPRGCGRSRLARRAGCAGPLRRRGRPRDREPHMDGDGGRSGMHLTSSPVDWYAARAAGIVAYLMLTAVVTLGIAMAGRAPGRRWRRWPMFAVEDVHRVGGLLVGSFIALHVVTIAIDSFLPFSLGQLAIPLAAGYRPIWTALGIVAAELLLALAVTNHYRRRIPRRLWRSAHYANFVVWGAATLHGIGSGTDRSTPWMIALFAVCAAAVAAAVTWRVGVRRELGTILRPGAVLGAGGAAAVVVVALALGPLHTHARPWNASRFSDALTGKILQQSAVTRALVSMTGTATGAQNALVRADLLVGPQQLEATSFQLELLPSGAVCRGKVQTVRSFGFDAVCTLADGTRRHVHAAWRLVDHANLRGTLSGVADRRPII